MGKTKRKLRSLLYKLEQALEIKNKKGYRRRKEAIIAKIHQLIPPTTVKPGSEPMGAKLSSIPTVPSQGDYDEPEPCPPPVPEHPPGEGTTRPNCLVEPTFPKARTKAGCQPYMERVGDLPLVKERLL